MSTDLSAFERCRGTFNYMAMSFAKDYRKTIRLYKWSIWLIKLTNSIIVIFFTNIINVVAKTCVNEFFLLT